MSARRGAGSGRAAPARRAPLDLAPVGPLLVRVSRAPWADWERSRFPFSVPALRTFASLDCDAPVTLFVGENGTGKSTLLEALAVAAELPALGSDAPRDDPTLDGARTLAAALRLAWRVRQRHGFFLRAEDYFGWARAQARLDARLAREASHGPDTLDDETGRHVDDVAAARYIGRYDARSHGESFLDAFTGRITAGRGLYLLDEPEAALSPQRQLAFVALVLERVATGAQFIIATHSPIVLALALAVEGAKLYSFDEGEPVETTYDAVPHVVLTREFLGGPERYLRLLGGE